VKQHIAFIIPGGIGTGHNNIGVPVLERIVKLLSKNFHITVFSLFKINVNYEQNGFELISITGTNSIIKILKFIPVFIRLHRRRKFRIIHGFWALPSGFIAVLIGKIFQIKSVVSILGGDAIALPEINYGQLQKYSSRKFILWTLNNADEVISLTQYLVDNLKSFGINRNFKIIPWGIDTSIFTFKDKKLGTPIQFLHIGNLNAVKDQTTLLKAFQIISNNVECALTIIGEGRLELEMKILARELGLASKVTFLGLLPYEELPKYYWRADILLHTSLSEGQSEVVTEAMSSGVIVCGTNVGLLYDQPDCCIAVPLKDFKMLASEVIQLLKDSSKMNFLKQNAYTWSSKHSIQWTVDMMSKLYAEPIAPKTC
jgi:glycosyltransferase involved in cell wall biosynthesis